MSTELALCIFICAVQQPRTPHHPRPHPVHVEHVNDHPKHAGPRRFECRIPVAPPVCGPFVPGFLADRLLAPAFCTEVVSTVEFFGPPVGFGPFGAAPFDPFGPFGFGGFAPVFVRREPVFVPVFIEPAPLIEPRVLPRLVRPVTAPAGTTDIPERVIDDLIGRRRPTLAQRAHAAKLEGAGDRMFVAGYFARAAERYQQALAQAPDNDDAKFKRGAALVAAGQFGEAGRVLREALRERPDWPFVAHDLRALFPDEAAVTDVFEKLDRESRRANAENDVEFLLAYFLYFTGDRRSAEAIFMNLPAGGSTAHYDVFREAIARQRGGGR